MNVQRKGKGNGKGKGGKSQSQRQIVVRANNPIPKGLPQNHHFNAFGNPSPQALAFSVGPATHLTGMKNFTETLSPGSGNRTLIMFQFSGGYKQATYWTSADGGVTWSGFKEENIDSTGVTGTASAASPHTIMVSRGSVRLRCFTKLLDVHGIVRVLRCSTRLNYGSATTNQDKTDIMELIRGNPRTRTYSAKELLDTHQWDAIPIDQASYHSFEPPIFGAQAAAGATSYSSMGLTTIAFLFEDVSVTQDYEFSMATTQYGRFDTIGPLAAMARHPPTTSVSVMNSVRDIAEKVGSAGYAVGKAIEGVGYGLGRAYQFARALAPAARPLPITAI